MRRIPLSRHSHVTGFRPVDGEAVEHESALERDFVLRTNFLDAVAAITSQPITIEFQDGARLRRYTPDFRMIWSDGGTELVEVKYRVDLRVQWARLRPGFIAARAMARENGGRFRIATERSIRGPLLDNARRLLPLRKAPLDLAISERALGAARSLCEPTFGRLVIACKTKRCGALWSRDHDLCRGSTVAHARSLEATQGSRKEKADRCTSLQLKEHQSTI